MAMQVRPITGVIGAEVDGVDLREELDAATVARLRAALLEHLVLFFRDQPVTPAQQLAFARRFGPLDVHAFARSLDDHPEVVVLDQVEPEKDGANSWHTDSSFMVEPPLGSILRAVQLPPVGGDTSWASMYAAYDALSAPLRAMLDTMTAEHDIIGPLTKAAAGGHSVGDLDEIRARWPVVRHPVVRVHPETGRKLLYVNNNFTTRLCGLTERESVVLLGFLLDHVRSPDLQCRFRWEPDSIAFWDNRATQHYAVPDYSVRRVMHRVTITGGPVAGPDGGEDR